ncbi:helix-turn-helix transcriptional regulator [Deinococcus pimensis]|uniref:helix-turn-helix transcriptional regulator n=1 Tax=Deinococcus pimensis TaxID=309888 RepID=UPI00048855A0|nr:LuxR C-terminal-related transcriptional regulator [Deinococcus pimensis]
MTSTRSGGASSWPPFAEHPESPLVGRERLRRTASDLLARPDVRLLTLRGEGGIGKTALALTLTRDLRGRYERLVWLDLTGVRTSDDVLPALRRALDLDLDLEGDPAWPRVPPLRDARMLIVLDNFEHVQGAAGAVARFLSELSDARTLVTSRVPLNVMDEHLLDVPPLDVTPSSAGVSDAARLFERLAVRIDPHFTLDGERLAPVEEICRRLDGVPLALELAAARLRVVSLSTLVAWLDRPLNVLQGGPLDRPERSRTYRGVVEWSCALLSEAEREVFRACGAFVGSFTLDALHAAIPLADLPGGLTRLVEHSLVRPHAWRADRFFLLEPVRMVARAKLLDAPDAPEVLGRHARHFLKLARGVAEQQAFDPALAWATLDPEDANLQAALAWFTDHEQVEEALTLCAALDGYWQSRARYTLALRACWEAARLPGAAGHAHLSARVDLIAAMAAARLGQFRLARELGTRGLNTLRDLGDVRGQVDALMTLGVLHHITGDLAESVRCDEAALALLGDEADLTLRGVIAHNLGTLHAQSGRHDDALSFLNEAQTLFERDANTYGAAHCHMHRAWVLLRTGRHPDARGELALGVRHARQLADVPLLIALHDLVATYALQVGEPRLAARVLSLADREQERAGERWNPQFQGDLDDVWRRLRAALPKAALTVERAAGEAASFEALVGVVDALLTREASVARDARLTPREWEVLRLVTQGQSDKQIARTLGISVKTASTHVSHLLFKLERRNRVQLARWADEQANERHRGP